MQVILVITFLAFLAKQRLVCKVKYRDTLAFTRCLCHLDWRPCSLWYQEALLASRHLELKL